MKLHTILRALAFACLLIPHAQVKAGQPGQTITLSVSQEKLEKVFKEIEAQVNVSFIYSSETMSRSKPVTIDVRNEQLDRLLPALFRLQPMTYVVDGNYIIIRAVNSKNDTLPLLASFTGKLVSEAGIAIAGATIQVKGTTIATTSNNNGEFTLRNLTPGTILLITGAELESTEIRIGNETLMTVTLRPKVNELDQVLVMAYGETTRRLNTGNIGKVSAEEIQRQPVSNPLAALHGRVPGVVVTQSSGVPGAHVKIEIRGQNSITQGSDPLFVIDGIPFGPNNGIINQLYSVAGRNNANSPGGLSPMNSINPGDIESIEILKDADATSIYGSRGANGVVLITTKKGKGGKTSVTVNAYSGFSQLTRTMPMLNTQQYVMMRKEAFMNDGLAMNTGNAYDILDWDTTRYTDMNEFAMGHTPTVNDVQVSVGGGNINNQFTLRSSYHRETTAFPGNMYEARYTVHFNYNHISPDDKFKLQLSAGYSTDKNNLINYSFPLFRELFPNNPPFYDSLGQLSWEYKGQFVDNPYGYLLQEYASATNTLLSNATLSYKVCGNLVLRALMGYNIVNVDEQNTFPRKSYSPISGAMGDIELARQKNTSWSIEPQLEWNKRLDNFKLTILLGATLQNLISNGLNITGSGFPTDMLINNLQSASFIDASNTSSEYRYQAGFARFSINYADKYLVNLSGRRDGSTRFGPGNRYANFGAAGIAWIFSKDLKPDFIPALSFGKLRFSYGTTGNDQIGNYQFLDTWSPTSNGYQGSLGLRPTRLFNEDYSWEVNKKAEVGIELGFFKDRLLLSAAYFRNRSGNQLINYNISSQTGFTSIIRNFPAVVENSGLEFSASFRVLHSSSGFNWNIGGNISLPENKLVSFPGIENTSYASTLRVGKPLRLINKYEFLGVNPQTGVYTFTDVNQDGVINSSDRMYLGSLVPTYNGGIDQQFSYKGIQLNVFFVFTKQLGPSYLSGLTSPPGDMINRPVFVLDRWQKPGDISNVQKFTVSTSSDAYRALSIFNASNGVYGDASFWRLKNLAISWQLPELWLNKIRATQCKLFVQGQNLLTFTSYKGSDPENQSARAALPLLKTFTGGLQITF